MCGAFSFDVLVGLLMPVRDPSLREIIRRQFDVYAIAHQDTDAISSHSARDRREDNMLAVVDLYLEESVGLFVHHYTG